MKNWWIAVVVLGVVGSGIVLWLLLRTPTSGPDPKDHPPEARSGAAMDSNSPSPGPSDPSQPSGTGTPSLGAPGFPVGDPSFARRSPRRSHWFFELGPEGFGLSRQEWTRLRMVTPHLGVPRTGPNPTVLPAFHYVTFEKPVGKTLQESEKGLQQLLEEVRRQKVPTCAHLLVLSRDLGLLEKGETSEPVEFLIPVVPDTRVEAPLVVRQMPEMRVWAMPSGAVGDDLGKAIQTLSKEARSQGFRIVPPILGRYEDENWVEAVKTNTPVPIRLYLVVEGGG